MHMCVFPGAGRTVEGSKETPVSLNGSTFIGSSFSDSTATE